MNDHLRVFRNRMGPQATPAAETGRGFDSTRRPSTLPESSGIRRAFLILASALTVMMLATVGQSLLHTPMANGVLPAPVAAAQGTGDELSIVGQYGGDVTAVAADGDRVYVGLGPRVAVLDVSDPTAPRLLGETDPLPGVVVDIAFEDGYVYAIAGGLTVVDVRTPQSPAQVGYLHVGEYDPLYGWVGPAHIAVSDGFAYMAGNVSYLVGRLNIVDVTNPRNPTIASRFEEYTATSVAVHGSLAYLSLRSCFGSNCTPDHVAMLVLDVTDPYAPKVIGDFAEPRGATHVVAAGTKALLLNSRCPFMVVDASDPGAPRLDECVSIQSMRQTLDAAVSGSIAYILGTDGRIFSFDISTGARALDNVYVAPGGAAVAASGSRVYSAHDVFGLGTVDASSPSNMRRRSVVQRPGSFADVAVDGSLAYVAGLYTGLHVVDASDVNNPVQIGSAPSADGLVRLAKIGSTVYGIGQGSGGNGGSTTIRAYDVSTPAQPQEIGSRTRDGLTDIVTDGRLLYATDSAGLQVFDPSGDASNPTLVGTYPSPRQSQFTRLAVGDGVAYLATVRSSGRNSASYELRVVDVSTPSSPRLTGTLPFAESVQSVGGRLGIAGMVVQGTNVFLANSMGYYSGYVELPFPLDQYVLVVDASSPDRPQLVGTWSTYERLAPNGIAVSGRFAYLGTWAGVRVLDIIAPGYPKPVARLDTPEIDAAASLGMAFDSAGNLFLPRLDAGLLIVAADVPPPPIPTAGPSPTQTSTGQPPPTMTPGTPTATNTARPGPTRRPTRTPTPTLRPGETPSPFPTMGPPPTRTRRPTQGPSPTGTSDAPVTPSVTSTGNVPGPTATPTSVDNTPVVVPTGSVTSTVTPSRTATGPNVTITPSSTVSATVPEPAGIYLPFVVVERR